ncbi:MULTISPECIES: cation transporter [Pseudomonas]|uniref:Cation diffusion facilitator family transporter n=2 Tax=Pseudomonadaceae TaxID=135621 RepID=A0A0D0J2E9_9PSED|nr:MULTISPECIES: cation transporter [Pseudomonas]KIP99698.1 cation diffusion facilitator family transporter [Pseudomonas fulva]MCW2291725.1 putative Co/Zn/Cd cation transporter (cation efflux family) [Pseudomonas sp. BIGb0408]NYH73704.1 putative Co/Zn/Cd cation transporter (cation efflux family) [Pseudomonas flavescens]
MKTEQGILRLSIAVTLLLAGGGILFGLLSGSFSIVFDGVYSLADASMSGLALIVATLIRKHTSNSDANRRLAERFNMGFWHLEPMVLALNGTLLCGVTLYALINAVGSLLAGGKPLDFGFAIIYALVATIACFSLAALEFRANKLIRSDFVALDAKAWVMSGSISLALLIAFMLGEVTASTTYGWLGPYIDPAVLAIICLVILPMPLLTIRQAMADILLVTPPALKMHVDEVASGVVAQQGFVGYEAYVAKVGRALQVELYFIVPADWPAQTLDDWDRLRDAIGEAIGDEGPNRWLTIAFTTDPQWAR